MGTGCIPFMIRLGFKFISSVLCTMMEQFIPKLRHYMSACVCDVPTTACAMTKFPMATRRHGLRDFQAFLYLIYIYYI